VILELRRYAPDDNADCRRVLTGLSRFEDTPAERVIELADDGYRTLGDRADAARDDIDEIIREVLPVGGYGITYEEVRKAWPTEKPPGERRLRGILNAGSNRGAWLRQGMGNKGGPYRYLHPEPEGSDSFPVVTPLRGDGRETNTNGQISLQTLQSDTVSGQDSSHDNVPAGKGPQTGA